MQVYLQVQKSWLQVERLPSYSPDLNPVEDLWGNLKGQELAIRARTIWANQKRHFEAAWGGSADLGACHLLSCTTQVFLFDQSVTVLCEIQ